MQIDAVSTIYAISLVITSSFPTTLIFEKTERSPNCNPKFSQSSASPLDKEILQFLTKLRKNERNAKGKFAFLFISECRVSSVKPKLRKKVVVTKRFWKINAFQPKIKANQGKNEEVQFWTKCKFGRIEEVVRLPNRNPKTRVVSRLNFVKWLRNSG